MDEERGVRWLAVSRAAGPAVAGDLIALARARGGATARVFLDTGDGAVKAGTVRDLDDRTVLLELDDGRLQLVPLNAVRRVGHRGA